MDAPRSLDRSRSRRRRRSQHVVRRRHRRRDGSYGDASNSSRRDNAREALVFGLVLACAAVAVLGAATNFMAAALLAFAILFYVVAYTMWLKRRTPQNIVIGGAAGALPPMIGWAAATGNIGVEPLVLFLIIFLWTPPHFWALSLNRAAEYSRAGVPMLPVVAGRAATTRRILACTILLVPVSLLPWALGFAGADLRGGCRRQRDHFVILASALPKTHQRTGELLIVSLHFPSFTCSRCSRRSWRTTSRQSHFFNGGAV